MLLWGAVALLLPLAGLGIWLAAVRLLPPHAAGERRVAMRSVTVSTPMSPAVSAAQTPVKAPISPVVGAYQARPADAEKEKKRLAPANPPKLPEPVAATTTVSMSGHAVAQQPAIRKEINQPTPREAADERYRKALTLIRAG